MTEPLFLALMIWSVVHLTAFDSALTEGDAPEARAALIKMTLVLIAAVFTRYDGWILGTLAWPVAAYWTLQRGWWKDRANAGLGQRLRWLGIGRLACLNGCGQHVPIMKPQSPGNDFKTFAVSEGD